MKTILAVMIALMISAPAQAEGVKIVRATADAQNRAAAEVINGHIRGILGDSMIDAYISPENSDKSEETLSVRQ